MPILKLGKISYIEAAAESGSNRILKLMNRNYTVEEYKNCINTIRKAHPKIIIRTQLIAGFPTETEEDFAETIHLLDDIIIDYVEVYEYAERPGTLSEKIQPKIPDQIKRQRYQELYKKALLNRTPRKLKNLLLRRP